MTKTDSVLESKLQELESILNELHHHHHPHDDQTQTPSNTDLSEDFKQKLVFIKNLFSAEISSSPPSKRHHLQHVAQRIKRLEETLQILDSRREFSYDQLEKGSSCSCTDSCINDDVEAVGEVGVTEFTEPEELSEGLNKAMVEWKGEEKQTSFALFYFERGNVLFCYYSKICFLLLNLGRFSPKSSQLVTLYQQFSLWTVVLILFF